MSKIVSVTLLAFFLGFFSSRLMVKTPLEVSESPSCLDLNSAKESLISISKNEYLEYTQIKDLRQKYEKADELLGKVMLLFLADVGFRAQKLEVVAKPAMTELPPPQSQSPTAKVESVKESSPNDVPKPRLEGKSNAIKNLRIEKRIREALDQAVIENPKMEMAKGIGPTPRQFKLLEGRYTGFIQFFDRKRENLTVIWDLTPDYTKPRLTGNFTLSIHGPGMNSETSGNGRVDNILSLSEDKDGFLISGCGGDCFLQLYHNAPTDQFYGNYYEAAKGSNSERRGIIDLKK